MKLLYEKDPPHMYCMGCSLPHTLSKSLHLILCDNEKDVLKRCDKCGSYNTKPPDTCKMWGETRSRAPISRAQIPSNRGKQYL